MSETKNIGCMLSTYLKQYLDDFPEEHKRAPGIHASEISGCLRVPFYTLCATPKINRVDAEGRKIFEVGHALHDRVQSWFEGMSEQLTNKTNMKVTFEREVPINPHVNKVAKEYNIYSSCDGLFCFTEEDGSEHKIVVEIKTKSPELFSKLHSPEKAHIEQAHVYMACLGARYTWFVYLNKGNQNITESNGPFLIEFDEKIWETLTDRFTEILHAYVTNNPPERKESWNCRYCSYANVCDPKILRGKDASTKT